MTASPAGDASLVPRPAGEAARRRPAILVPGRVRPSAVTIVAFAAVLNIVQIVNWAMHYRLNSAGIRARTVGGLWGVLDAPLLHTSWSHLASNLVPLLVFGFLILLGGLSQFIAVTVLVSALHALRPLFPGR